MKKIIYTVIALLLAGILLLLFGGSDDAGPAPTVTATLAPAEKVARGAYLAKAGD